MAQFRSLWCRYVRQNTSPFRSAYTHTGTAAWRAVGRASRSAAPATSTISRISEGPGALRRHRILDFERVCRLLKDLAERTCKTKHAEAN
jgi:hypothetical protein